MQLLTSLGYITVLNPSSEIKPLQLLVQSRGANVSSLNASITDLFKPRDVAPPVPSKNITLVNQVQSNEILQLSAQTNFDFILGLLNRIKGKVDFDRSSTVNIHFEALMKNIINVIALDAFINDAIPNEASRSFIQRLKEGDVYVITEVIKTPSLTMSFSKGQQITADQHATFAIGNGQVVMDTEKNTNKTLSYSGQEYLVIGIKACKIRYDKPGFFSKGPSYFRLLDVTNQPRFKSDEEFLPANFLAAEAITIKPFLNEC